MRYDETDWFNRRSDGKTVLWMAAASETSYLYHATADGLVAVCSSLIAIDRERDPSPGTVDRSQDTMSCLRCQSLVRRIPMPIPRPVGTCEICGARVRIMEDGKLDSHDGDPSNEYEWCAGSGQVPA